MTFPAKSLKWMAERSKAFQRGTQRRKMPMTYGTGKTPKERKAARGK